MQAWRAPLENAPAPFLSHEKLALKREPDKSEALLLSETLALAALQKALVSKSKFMERDAAQKLLDSLPAGGQ
jgi:hypothetical protein